MMRIASGKSTKEIAGEMNISPKTVANLHYLIKTKLGVGSDIELVRLALRQGLLTRMESDAALPPE